MKKLLARLLAAISRRFSVQPPPVGFVDPEGKLPPDVRRLRRELVAHSIERATFDREPRPREDAFASRVALDPAWEQNRAAAERRRETP